MAQTSGDKTRFSLGTPRNALWSIWSGPLAAPRFFVELSVRARDPAAKRAPSARAREAENVASVALGPEDLTLDLLLPDGAALSAAGTLERKLDVAAWGTDVGSPIRFTLTFRLLDAPRLLRVKIELETYLRDVVGTRSAATPAP